MKNSQHKLSATKKKLRELREKGKKEVFWKLTEEQFNYLMEQGYKIVPEIYLIRTKKFCNYKKLCSLLKEIHWAKLKGKNELAKKLKWQEIQILEEYGIKYRTIKYRIKLV